MVGNIANSLGFGSGINVSQMVSDLATASRAPKVERFDALARASQAKISAVAQARANLDSFADSLTGLVAGGSLRSQPTVSNEAALSAATTAGVPLGQLSGEIEIIQLARAQTSYSALRTSASDPIGQGMMTLAVGGISYGIAIGAANDSLTGLADAINAIGSGVRANILTDQGQVRLVLKGETGAAKGFTLTPDAGAAPGLAQFTTSGGGLTTAQNATDALFTLDGIGYARSTNTVSDVLPGVTLTLKKAQAGETIAIGSTRPTEAIRQTIDDFVSVFNELSANLKAARSAGGGNIRTLDRQLAALIGKPLTGGSDINSLASIGLKTGRDGTLSVDQARLNAVLAGDPDAVEALFNPPRGGTRTQDTDPGLAIALDAIRDAAVDGGGPLQSLEKTLQAEASAIAKNRERMEAREDAYRARLENRYASLDARIGAYKATQSYLEQQIKLWSNER